MRKVGGRQRPRGGLPYLVLIVVACLAAVGLTMPAPAGAAEALAAPTPAGRQARYNRFDVGIAIDPSGNFRVSETQEVAFTGGPFQRASRTISLDNVEDVQDIAVREPGGPVYTRAQEPGQPGTYTVRRSGDALTVEWYFPATRNARRTFQLDYTVVGGLRINPDVDVLDWTALRPDLAADVGASTVTVTLPSAVDPARIATDTRGASARTEIVDGRTVRFLAGAVPKGRGLGVKVAFPHGLVSAAPPPWQGQFEQRQEAERVAQGWRDLINLVLGALGLLILVGGALSLYLLWYLRGRDRHTGLVAEYLREPPSDLHPGAVGTLLDEHADFHDVLAMFTDLGRRGVLRITETRTPGVLGTGLGAGTDFRVERLASDAPLSPVEQLLLQTLFPNGETEVQLSEVKRRFTAMIPRFQAGLYDEVMRHGYFNAHPEQTRQRYRGLGSFLIFGAIAGSIALFFLFGSALSWQIIPAIALVIIGLALRSLARAMPAKTLRGAEEAAKWTAFRRYLANLERYDNLEDAKAIFARYLPYATAFGLERSWVEKFARVNAPVPAWYGGGGGFGGGPIVIVGDGGGGFGGGYYGGGGGYVGGGGPVGGGQPAPPTGDFGGGGGGDWSIPTLQDLSDRGGGGMQSMSDGLMGMLDSASGVFGSGGGDSGGGWGGGGWGGGGDGGGGGSDFG